MNMPTPPPSVLEPAPEIKRSVFGNYTDVHPTHPRPGDLPESPPHPTQSQNLPQCAEQAFCRSFIYQFFARAFEYPTAETWNWLCDANVQAGLTASLSTRETPRGSTLPACGHELHTLIRTDAFGEFLDDYISTVGHAARGSCPINEIEYSDLKADPLFQPHRLADLAAFYRAFGLELGSQADERLDHLSVELEFMSVLTAQEATLLNTTPEHEALLVCREAQRKFLAEHLGRWFPAFAHRLTRALDDSKLEALAQLALAYLAQECQRVGAKTGGREVVLRPTDDSESLCEGCGLPPSPSCQPPGDAATEARPGAEWP